MKTTVFAVVPDYHYRFDRLPLAELMAFEPTTDCVACGELLDAYELARLGGDAPEQGLKLVACRGCGHVSYDRLPTTQWLDCYYRDVWDQSNRQAPIATLEVKMSSWTPWAFPWRHLEALRVSFAARVLEFGCGFGHGIKYLHQLGYRDVYGVEIGTHRAASAARHFPGRVLCGSTPEAEALAVQHGSFDLIVLHHVAEHLRDPYAVIERLSKLLSPGGVVLIAVPNLFHECPLFPTLYFPHLQHFNTASLMRLLKRAGLTPLRWTAGEEQLVVAGSVDSTWHPDRDYNAEIPALTDAMLARLAEFVAAPWMPADRRRAHYVCYFHPWLPGGTSAGFQHLGGWMSCWLTLGRYACLPLIAHLPNRRGYGAFLRAGQRLFGHGAIVGTEILGFRQEPSPHNGAPWLRLPNGDMPVLVK